ncbi:MAG: M48 family metalloprotease [Elainellaceae cyanobacterium]
MNQFKTVGLLGLLSGLLIAISYWVIGGTGGAIIGVGIAAVMNLGSWYYSDRIALSAYRAQPVGPNEAPALHQMVQKLSDRAELPMPAVYVIPTQSLNAFATGRDPEHAAVAVTQGLMNMLPADELEGVLAHEMTHIRNRDTLTQAVAATLGGAISFLAQMVSYSLWFGGMSRDDNRGSNPLGLLLTVMLAPMAASIIQLGISRTREYSADAGAAELTGNPRALASALQRLDQSARRMPIQANPAFEPLLIMNAIPKVGLNNLFSTHPSTEDRVSRLLKLEQNMGVKVP